MSHKGGNWLSPAGSEAAQGAVPATGGSGGGAVDALRGVLEVGDKGPVDIEHSEGGVQVGIHRKKNLLWLRHPYIVSIVRQLSSPLLAHLISGTPMNQTKM